MADFGPFGVWTRHLQWPTDRGELADTAAELESLGYSAAWIGGSPPDNLGIPEAILASTSRLVVGTSIIDVWRSDAATLAASHARVRAAYPGRFILGLGSGHASIVEPTTGQQWVKPISKLGAFLDQLDAADDPAPPAERALAALGPRALSLAAERTLGALPYLVPPEYTADARRAIGPGVFLAPGQEVYLGTDPRVARDVGRKGTAMFLQLPNYLNNLRRYGLTDDDFAGGGSDRWVDTLVAWGDESTVHDRVNAHLKAGADHVAMRVLSGDTASLPLAEWRAVADVIFG